MLVVNLDYADFFGRLAVGRIVNGRLCAKQDVGLVREGGNIDRARISHLYAFEGLERVEVDEAGPGDIVQLAGSDEGNIGDTITDADDPRPLPRVTGDEPTGSTRFSVQHAPSAAQE